MSAELVEHALAATFPGEEVRQQARGALSDYGTASYEREVDRVRLAVLKLSHGELDKLLLLVKDAKADYRDVLAWAEYPDEMSASWALRQGLTDEEQKRLAELRAGDRKRYEDWLRGLGK